MPTDQTVASSFTSQNTATEQTWQELEAASFRAEAKYLGYLARVHDLDEATIKRLIFLRFRLMSRRN